jgi:hypothetical protein
MRSAFGVQAASVIGKEDASAFEPHASTPSMHESLAQ